MPLERIDRVVSRADEFDIRSADYSSDSGVRIFPQHLCAFAVDLACVFRCKWFGHSKIAFQLEVAPMDHRISNGQFQRFCKFFDSVLAVTVSGHIVFTDSCRAHDTPFVVIAEISAVRILPAQPDLRQIVEAAVLIYLFRWNMTVIVYYRHVFGILVKQPFRGIIFKNKLFVHKGLHICTSK